MSKITATAIGACLGAVLTYVAGSFIIWKILPLDEWDLMGRYAMVVFTVGGAWSGFCYSNLPRRP